MNRCAQLSLALALAGSFAAFAPANASAQGFVGPGNASAQGLYGPANTPPPDTLADGQSIHRSFPQTALRGKIVFGQPPVITMNGVVTRMAPAYRVHGVNNLLVMAAQLDGLTATVNYTRDVEGHVLELWILSPAEIAKLWPVALEQATTWSFNPTTQTWTRP